MQAQYRTNSTKVFLPTEALLNVIDSDRSEKELVGVKERERSQENAFSFITKQRPIKSMNFILFVRSCFVMN